MLFVGGKHYDTGSHLSASPWFLFATGFFLLAWSHPAAYAIAPVLFSVGAGGLLLYYWIRDQLRHALVASMVLAALTYSWAAR